MLPVTTIAVRAMRHYLQVAYTLLIETSSNCKGQLSDKFD